MNYYFTLLVTYIIGGITFIPLLIVLLYLYSSISTVKKHVPPSSDILENKQDVLSHNQFYKVGWLFVTRGLETTGRASSIGGIVKSYLSSSSNLNSSLSSTSLSSISSSPTPLTTSKNDSYYFAVLKFNTLYLYDSELQLDCKGIINVSQHSVHIYPNGLKDHELFSKINRILLKKRHLGYDQSYYLNCSRCVDKEDWYFALRRASKLSSQHGEPPSHDLQSSTDNPTHFDQDAMNHLISTIHSNPSHFEMQWFNALLGRIFLGIYKTDKTRGFFYNKILSKVDKLNARRPQFLEEISLRSVDAGHGAPQITQPRFIHLSPQGEYTGDVHLFYDGHFRVELETVLRWTVSDRLPPLRVDVVLAITLKSIEGKLMLKIKEPPTNRVWMGFYKKPKMEWLVEPVLWDKRIGYPVVSKAIQTKIEEILTETLVLPNMDDMVFFKTDGAGFIGESTKEEYQSMPELYSSPSEVVVTADSFPLLSTAYSVSPPQKKKRWFNKNAMPETMDLQSTSHDSDTPSQQSLKSFMMGNKKSPKKRPKRRKTLTAKEQVLLATSVDHSIDSLQKLNYSKHNSDGESVLDDESSIKNNALHSVRLSKSVLDYPSRLRSKSLPSTSLSEISSVGQNSLTDE